MAIVVSLFLLTTALSVVMLFVLSSLAHSNVPGIRGWMAGNAMAVIAVPLFAARGAIPDFLSVEVANALLLSTTAAMLVGFRQYLSLPVPWSRLGACIAAGCVAIALLHHVIDSMLWRIVSMSVLHCILCAEMAVILRAGLARAPHRYSWRFTISAAWLNAGVQGLRAFVYGMSASGHALPVDDNLVGIVFASLGTLSLPGLTLGAVMIVNAELIAKARHAADHDYLTGAHSRRAFFQLARREQARGQRHGMPLSVLLFDVDHFKRINDTHGHAEGDRVLVDIVERTRASVRAIDLCGRLGGEEFAVLMPDTSEAMARVAAERLRARFEHRRQSPDDVTAVAYTASFGVATMERDETVEQMLSRADEALYRAKADGRNRVAMAAPANAA